MKKLILALGFIAFGLVVFNCFHVDFAAPFEGDSIVALGWDCGWIMCHCLARPNVGCQSHTAIK